MVGTLCEQIYERNFFVKHNNSRLKEICIFKKQPQEQPKKSHEQDILQKHFSDRSINRSLRPAGCVT